MWPFRRITDDQLNTRAAALVLLGFAYQKIAKAELRSEHMRGRNVNRCEQFEISPETIEQELRPVVCEQRQSDAFYKSYSMIVCTCAPCDWDTRQNGTHHVRFMQQSSTIADNGDVMLPNRLYWNGHNFFVHQLLRLYLCVRWLSHVTSDVIRTIVVRRRPNRMLTYVIT